jgi:predicted RNA-binding protein with PIN domain
MDGRSSGRARRAERPHSTRPRRYRRLPLAQGGSVPLAKRRRWPSDPGSYRWIVDGHNAIFAHPVLEALQTSGEKGEARRRLEQMLERFAARFQTIVQIVYDGNRIERNPDLYRGPRASSTYTLAPEEADDRIIWMARASIARGERVVVVSSDRMTLGSRLPAGVVQVEPSELYSRIHGRNETRPRGRPAGDFSDIEEQFLAAEGKPGESEEDMPAPTSPRSLDLGVVAPQHRKVPAGREATPPKKTGAGADNSDPGRASIDAKRERGRRKHERRLIHRQANRRKGKKQR